MVNSRDSWAQLPGLNPVLPFVSCVMLVLGNLNPLCLSCHNHEMGVIVVLVVVRISHYLYIKSFINFLNKTHIHSLAFGGLPQVHYFVVQGNVIALHKAPLALPRVSVFSSLSLDG